MSINHFIKNKVIILKLNYIKCTNESLRLMTKKKSKLYKYELQHKFLYTIKSS